MKGPAKPFGKSLVTIGTFDGVHRGHQKLILNLVKTARRLGLKPRVVLFAAPPRYYFRPETAMPLLTLEGEREELLRGLGVAEVTRLVFGRRWAEMPHTRFFSEFLVRRCRAGGLLVGPDFACGKGRLGDVRWLRRACRERGLGFAVQPILDSEGRKISSSRIRELLKSGDAAGAAELLGRPHFVDGRVRPGRGLGRKLGFPTANLEVDPKKLVPLGVYRVRVRALGWKGSPLGAGLPGVLNAGTRPTVDSGGKVHVEVHVPGFAGSLYGRRLRVEFLRFLRPEKRFPSLDTLKKQIALDVRAATRSA